MAPKRKTQAAGAAPSRRSTRAKATSKRTAGDDTGAQHGLPTSQPAKRQRIKKQQAAHPAAEEPDAAPAGPADVGDDDTAAPAAENLLEQGRVFFLYRPRVVAAGDEPDVEGLGDLQRLYMLLQPSPAPAEAAGGTAGGGSGAGGKQCRLIIVPKKKLPSPERHERFFAFVEAVGDSPGALTARLTESTHSTKTRGERTQPAARAAGEGTYVIARGGHSHGVHLGFTLTSPAQPGEAQAVLGITQEASFVLSARNPARKGEGAPSAGPAPAYTEVQQAEFDGRAWIGVEDTSLLDVVGTELLLVGASAAPTESGQLGAAGAQLQQLSAVDAAAVARQGGPEEALGQALEPAAASGGAGGGAAAAAGEASVHVGTAAAGQDAAAAAGGDAGGSGEAGASGGHGTGGAKRERDAAAPSSEAPIPVEPAVDGCLV